MSLILNGKVIAGNGMNGTSAYKAALNGGFTGTEQEFNQVLASEVDNFISEIGVLTLADANALVQEVFA